MPAAHIYFIFLNLVILSSISVVSCISIVLVVIIVSWDVCEAVSVRGWGKVRSIKTSYSSPLIGISQWCNLWCN